MAWAAVMPFWCSIVWKKYSSAPTKEHFTCWHLAGVKIQTGRKWKADDCVDNAITNLKHQEFVGRTQQGRQGLGWGEARNFLSKVSIKERKKLVITEEERLLVKSVGQGQQGQWTKLGRHPAKVSQLERPLETSPRQVKFHYSSHLWHTS